MATTRICETKKQSQFWMPGCLNIWDKADNLQFIRLNGEVEQKP
jgi:hypothetical protein